MEDRYKVNGKWRTHYKADKKKCPKCDFETNRGSALASHIRNVHDRVGYKVVDECEYCKKFFTNQSIHHKEHHEECCYLNPKNIAYCKECGKVIERKVSRHTKSDIRKYCSQSCSAKHNNRTGLTGGLREKIDNGGVHPRFNPNGENAHRDICLEHWEHKCVICDWDISVDIHHIDENHDNNDKENLIPLCANHHRMCSMNEHKDEMKVICEELRDEMWRTK